jgi:DNA-binding CsgD family transcriptional regulator
VTLLGLSGVGHVGIRFAADHSERVEALILCGTNVSLTIPSLYREVAAENWEFFLWSLVPSSIEPERVGLVVEGYKDSTTYEDYHFRGLITAESNIDDALARVSAPTLVLHPRRMRMSSLEGSAKLAALIPGARLVVIEGESAQGSGAEGAVAVERFIAEIRHKKASSQMTDGLSAREIDVLRLIAAGKTNPEIGEALFISRNTVQNHVASILNKAGLANRAEAAAYAARNGLS